MPEFHLKAAAIREVFDTSIASLISESGDDYKSEFARELIAMGFRGPAINALWQLLLHAYDMGATDARNGDYNP